MNGARPRPRPVWICADQVRAGDLIIGPFRMDDPVAVIEHNQQIDGRRYPFVFRPATGRAWVGVDHDVTLTVQRGQ
ncbi:hypothetical protein M8C13_36285 [Crossiella sp. SN42]|uniref:hypothetical protein n=1 Tax=Crossiella sp. SN42 TaxID=2944808 RepID=UPI00207CFD58|nr:hypothetical protein [Crossiella sp. SN42]MCO1581223.1 hypothetical protein [Crossiella sp. SN42]